ncbi:MAG: hypothetical protein KDD47_05270 [Acidobacteria bacterium]|nr:hypothetical protein [Acidobacteriota bacterium]
MEPSELLRFLVSVLEQLGLRYFVTGSTASIFFGEPRFTNDIDVVVDLSAEGATGFCSAFSAEDFYLSEDAVRRAMATKGHFNVLHPASGLKIDVIVPADDLFNRSRFERVQRVKPDVDYEAYFASAEDVIVKKMDFFREGGSEKHLRDIAGILRISRDSLDLDYVENWADHLGLEAIWRTILRKSLQDGCTEPG